MSKYFGIGAIQCALFLVEYFYYIIHFLQENTK